MKCVKCGAVYGVFKETDYNIPYCIPCFEPALDGGQEKASNPKQAFGDDRAPLHLVPVTMAPMASIAFLEGSLKYGAHNYKAIGVRASTYVAACGRHLAKWVSGEECDKVTKVPHLASALACLAIIVDAQVTGNLTDDRPPSTGVSEWLDGLGETVKHLKELFRDKAPKHYTIADKVEK